MVSPYARPTLSLPENPKDDGHCVTERDKPRVTLSTGKAGIGIGKSEMDPEIVFPRSPTICVELVTGA